MAVVGVAVAPIGVAVAPTGVGVAQVGVGDGCAKPPKQDFLVFQTSKALEAKRI